MPDIDRSADIKVTAAQGTVTAEMPLAETASEHWLRLFRKLASKRFHGTVPSADAAEREGRTWIVVRLLADHTARDTESMQDTVSALVSEANDMEQQAQSGAAQTEAAIRGWQAKRPAAGSSGAPAEVAVQPSGRPACIGAVGVVQ